MKDISQIQIVRSARKTMSLEVKPDGRIIARVPNRVSDADVRRFIEEHQSWLEKALAKAAAKAEARAADPVDRLTEEEIRVLAKQAMTVIPDRVRYYAPKIGVTYGRITIRNQRTRWGSCSSKGNLNFNCLLMLAPLGVLDSVVVHELCHRKEMNHSKRFYEEVYKAFPEYDKWHGWLKEHGPELMQRMTGE